MKSSSVDLPSRLQSASHRLPLPKVDDASLPGRVLLVAQVASLLALTATVASRVWQDHAWVGVLLILVTLVVWLPELPRERARRWMFVYVWGIFVYTLLRAVADETPIPTHWTYAKRIDEALFFGTNPVAWLQGQFFDPTDISWLDRGAVAVHWSFFVIPHAVALAIFVRERQLFPRYALVLVGTMWIGLVLFFLVPTAPPWLVATTGESPNVYRVMDFVGGEVDPETYHNFYSSLGEPNSVAAMPSIHEGAIFAMFLWAFWYHRRLSLLFLAYAILTGVSLVYLGEHYVVDLLAGATVATLCWFAVLRYTRPPETPPGAGGVSRPAGRAERIDRVTGHP